MWQAYWPHHQITHHEFYPGILPKERSSASVPRLQLKCSFSCQWHIAHFKLTLEMACHPDLHLTTVCLDQFCVWVCRTSYLVTTKTFSCVCISCLFFQHNTRNSVATLNLRKGYVHIVIVWSVTCYLQVNITS
jgi:hypothetical protein